MELNVSLETVCRIIGHARELEAQVAATDTDDDDDDDDAGDSDDAFAGLDDETDEAVEDEIRNLLDDLADDEITAILALAWVGRGTYDSSEWDEALEEAGNGGEDAVEQLLDMPMLAGYLEAGLTAFDLDCDAAGQND